MKFSANVKMGNKHRYCARISLNPLVLAVSRLLKSKEMGAVGRATFGKEPGSIR